MSVWSWALALPWTLATRLLHFAVHTVLIVTIVFAFCYQMGWFHRFIWYMAERETRQALNGTMVTIGSLEMDLLRGTADLSNVIVHAPQRHLWKWESPLLARVGKIHVETNLVRVLLSLFLLGEEPPLEIYTLHLSDIQVFVERKQEVFNIYLLDPHNVIPAPELEDEDDEGGVKAAVDGMAVDPSDSSHPPDDAQGGDLLVVDGAVDPETSTPAEEEKALKMVDEMIKAVQSLGRAAREGSLPKALQRHRQSVTTHLKELQAQPIKSNAMKDGIRLVQRVSKAVVQKTQTVQQIVQQPDKRTLDNDKIVYARFGRVVMDDLRVFTRSSVTNETEAATKKEATTTTSSTKESLLHAWNKPIVVEHLAVRPSEFCAPLSVKDEEGLPVLYRPINYCMDAIVKRVVSEMAKSNTGRLLRTAMGEILDFWVEKELQVGAPGSKEPL